MNAELTINMSTFIPDAEFCAECEAVIKSFAPELSKCPSRDKLHAVYGMFTVLLANSKTVEDREDLAVKIMSLEFSINMAAGADVVESYTAEKRAASGDESFTLHPLFSLSIVPFARAWPELPWNVETFDLVNSMAQDHAENTDWAKRLAHYHSPADIHRIRLTERSYAHENIDDSTGFASY